MSCFMRLPMTSSPTIVTVGSFGSCLFFRLYFLHSNFWICLLAMAIMEGIAISKKLSESVLAL